MYADAEKHFDGFYLVILECVILNIVNCVAVSGSDIINRECVIAIHHYPGKINVLEKPGCAPTFLFILCHVQMIVPVRARESKVFGKLIGYHIPFFFFKPGIEIPYELFLSLRMSQYKEVAEDEGK